jgi:hypothetical protein
MDPADRRRIPRSTRFEPGGLVPACAAPLLPAVGSVADARVMWAARSRKRIGRRPSAPVHKNAVIGLVAAAVALAILALLLLRGLGGESGGEPGAGGPPPGPGAPDQTSAADRDGTPEPSPPAAGAGQPTSPAPPGVPPGSQPPDGPGQPGTPGEPGSGGGSPGDAGDGGDGTGGTGREAQPPRRRPVGPAFTVVGGEGCRHTSATGYRAVGAYTDGVRGWYKRSGGWTGDGCRGTFDAVPLSGHAGFEDRSAYALWSFSTAPVRTGRCSVSVYVPRGQLRDVGARPAWYQVLASERDHTAVGTFAVDQLANRGRWVDAGSYPLAGGDLAVKLTTRGVDPNGEHAAAAQMRVSCRP